MNVYIVLLIIVIIVVIFGSTIYVLFIKSKPDSILYPEVIYHSEIYTKYNYDSEI